MYVFFQLWAKSIDQAKKLYKASLVVRNQGDAIVVLVGAPKLYILSNHLQHEIANLCSVPDDEVQDTATSYVIQVCYTESTKMQLLSANKVVR